MRLPWVGWPWLLFSTQAKAAASTRPWASLAPHLHHVAQDWQHALQKFYALPGCCLDSWISEPLQAKFTEIDWRFGDVAAELPYLCTEVRKRLKATNMHLERRLGWAGTGVYMYIYIYVCVCVFGRFSWPATRGGNPTPRAGLPNPRLREHKQSVPRVCGYPSAETYCYGGILSQLWRHHMLIGGFNPLITTRAVLERAGTPHPHFRLWVPFVK